jgi:hypothetical protein
MIIVLWSLTALVLVFLVFRAYTRIICVASYGADDHFYAVTCVSIIFTVLKSPRMQQLIMAGGL